MIDQSENSSNEGYIPQALKEVTFSLITDIDTKRKLDRKDESSLFYMIMVSIVLVLFGLAIVFYSPNLESAGNRFLMEMIGGALSILPLLALMFFTMRQNRVKKVNQINYEIDTEHKAELLKSLIQRHRVKRDHEEISEREENIVEELRLLEAEAALKKLKLTNRW